MPKMTKKLKESAFEILF